MIKYKANYCKFFGYDESSWISCEGCEGGTAVEIHHIKPRSLMGSDEADNLAAVCRDCHDKAGSDPEFNKALKVKHAEYYNRTLQTMR